MKPAEKNPWQGHFLPGILQTRLGTPASLARWDDWTGRWASPAQRPLILGEISGEARAFFLEVSTPSHS